MATDDAVKVNPKEKERVKAEWLSRLTALVEKVEKWAGDLDWTSRRIEKRMTDTVIGSYVAPALVMQRDATRIMLEPVARTAPGSDGVVDLYLMPAFDDIATLFHHDSAWHLHYSFASSHAVAKIKEGRSRSLTKEALRSVLDAMTRNGK